MGSGVLAVYSLTARGASSLLYETHFNNNKNKMILKQLKAVHVACNFSDITAAGYTLNY